jgi:thiamine transport system permease protein
MSGAGLGVAAALVALTLGTLAAVLAQAGGGGLGAADAAALRFTLVQAALSALVSVGLAVPVARALARRRFPGRTALITLMGAPFLLPAIVAVMALLAVFGRGGPVHALATAAGLPPPSVYGLHGVVLAHVFLNLPLAVRMILSGWRGIPAERFRLAAALDLGPAELFRHLEWPMLRRVLPGALLAVFLVCLSSFAVALVLGGGPRATTVELAIYQALRFDFDPGQAAALAALQFAVSAAAVGIAARLTLPPLAGAGLDRPVERWDARSVGLRWLDAAVIGAAALFLLAPLLAMALAGLPGLGALPGAVWPAAARSVGIALVAAPAAVAGALALALAAQASRRQSRWIDLAGMLPLAASPMVLGTGLFLILHPLVAPEQVALAVTALVNAALALPFALRLILPALSDIEAAHGRLADALGLTGATRLRWLVLPRLRPVLGFTLGLAAALSIGDLGAIALFAAPGQATLPLLVQQLMGAYRMDEAAAAALLLVAIAFGLFGLCDRWGRRADA